MVNMLQHGCKFNLRAYANGRNPRLGVYTNRRLTSVVIVRSCCLYTTEERVPMAKHKNPAERSASIPPRPGEPAAKPTGNEVFGPTRHAAPQGEAHLPEEVEETPPMTEEPLEDTLLTTADRYYERLTEAAERLSSQAADAFDSGRLFVRDHPGRTVLGAFAIGVIVAVLSRRK